MIADGNGEYRGTYRRILNTGTLADRGPLTSSQTQRARNKLYLDLAAGGRVAR